MRGLGATGVQVGPLGLASTFGKSRRDIEWAFDLGCNYLVVKPKRQPGFMDAIKLFARTQRDRLVLAVEATPSCSLTMRVSLELTLRRLGVKHIDCLLLGHRSGTEIDRLFETAVRLKEQGKVRFLGLALSRRHKNRLPIHRLGAAMDIIHTPCNAANPDGYKSLLHDDGRPDPALVGVYATANGSLLRSRPGMGRPPTVPDCYRFTLSQPGISVCLAGSPAASDLRSALGALDLGPLSEEQSKWMREAAEAAISSGQRLRSMLRPSRTAPTETAPARA